MAGWTPCSNWIARSVETNAFDVVDTAFDEWYVRLTDQGNREITLDRMQLSCFDCEDDITYCGGGHGYCVPETGICACIDGYYGVRCEFVQPCTTIQFDSTYEPFSGQGSQRPWSTSYEILQLDDGDSLDDGVSSVENEVSVYNRPVYIAEYEEGFFDAIFFTGRRWVATSSSSLRFAFDDSVDSGNNQGGIDGNSTAAIQVTTKVSRQDIAKYFRNKFHAHWSNYSVAYISNPLDAGTLEDSVSPIGSQWYPAQIKTDIEVDGVQLPDLSNPLDSVFLCSYCTPDNGTNPCLFDGVCVDHKCECALGASGALCQVSPVSNGRCDPYYNIADLFFDGGDCCEQTCISGDQFQCGKTGTSGPSKDNLNNLIHIGYPRCHLGSSGWQESASSVIGGDTLSGFAVALSGNGRILAVGEPNEDRARLFDRTGAQWIEREDSTLQGPVGSKFGSSVVLSRGALDIVNNPISVAPIQAGCWGTIRGYCPCVQL